LTPYGDVCEVTLISSEDLDHIESELGICVKKGEHRRNIVTRSIRLDDLCRKRFRVGETVLEYERPRPPCRHVQDLTEPGMTRALERLSQWLGSSVVAAMLKEAPSVVRRHRIERPTHRLDQHLAATSLGFTQQRLELGERFFLLLWG
jgi:hypothetical protein